MMISIDIPGAKIVEVGGDPALAFGSYKFEQEDIRKILECGNVRGILFYQATFNSVDLSILQPLQLKRLTVLHGGFGDVELSQIKNFDSLTSLKLLDTKVSETALSDFLYENPQVNLI